MQCAIRTDSDAVPGRCKIDSAAAQVGPTSECRPVSGQKTPGLSVREFRLGATGRTVPFIEEIDDTSFQ
jgi:hypothetical protein